MRNPAAGAESGLIALRVQPRARRDEITGWQGDVLRVRVAAAPTDGLANRAVLALLADRLGVGVSRLELVGGAASRDKRVRVDGLSKTELRLRLGGARS